jgi:arylsulfatase A-like enzyme
VATDSLAGVRPNVVFITLDQFRGDSMSCAGHPLVQTPHLDALAADGVRFARHYSQAAPCAPGRAALYTGMYQMNNRVVANGTPLDARFDNVALAARRAGYAPALFGYTDQSIDPRIVTDPVDPRLSDYEGVLPGFDHVLDLTKGHDPWIAWLRELGHDLPADVTATQALRTEPLRPAEHSVSAFLTDEALRWVGAQAEPWFAHLSYLRPHPPYAAAGRWAERYDPADVDVPIRVADQRHPWHDVVLRVEEAAAPAGDDDLRHLRAQYYGMIGEVDDQLGRLFQGLRDLGVWDDTVVVVTADHGEMLGDHGLVQKLGYWEGSYHIPCIVRDPRRPQRAGTVVDRFTENVDVLPTLCEVIGEPVPLQCDGRPLTPFLRGEEPRTWRTAAHWEFDWRSILIRVGLGGWPDDRRAEHLHLATVRTVTHAYVQFGDGSWRCFDLAADPTWRTEVVDPAVVLPLAQEMLVWRSTHADRTLADMLNEDGGIGRRPAGSPLRG